MSLTRRVASAGIVFLLLLATGISGPRRTLLASGVNPSKEGPAIGPWSDIKELQQTLWDKGQYRGKVDGVFGLQTRASIRGFQKAEDLPVTGQLDIQTSDKLGVRPEGRQETDYEATMSKPSPCIKWIGSEQKNKTARKTIKTVATPAGDRETTGLAEYDNQN
jgi:peptidoglycan hydrolase-like protein with peptidoglycan-binding domain